MKTNGPFIEDEELIAQSDNILFLENQKWEILMQEKQREKASKVEEESNCSVTYVKKK